MCNRLWGAGFGFRLWGSGFGVQALCSGFGVQASGFRLWGLRSRMQVQGLGLLADTGTHQPEGGPMLLGLALPQQPPCRSISFGSILCKISKDTSKGPTP